MSGALTAEDLAVNGFTGFVATFIGCAIINPFECLMIRYQVLSNVTEGIGSFGRNIIKTEGLWKGLWSPGILAHSIGSGGGAVGRIGIYPFVRDGLMKSVGAKEGEKPYSAMIAAGFITGGSAYLFMAPVYQVKTMAQAEAGMLVDGKFTTGTRIG